MKKIAILSLAAFAAGAMLLSSCSKTTPVKTIENLKAGITGETTASAKYAAFAAKARAEGYDTIAKMFDATSKAESIHANNHMAVLNKLGVEFTAKADSFTVMTTKENLEDAIKGESYENTTMYPEFIKAAMEEKVPEAVTSFTWALDTEKKHQVFYQNALNTINTTNTETGLPFAWAVCPKCGNTYDAAHMDDFCAFCQTPKEKFIMF
ncbi:MAG TPA: ferritin family protein [Williamwhitmania sp.]|nr:ferritin family protein [Williamwhitmania sp.]